MDDRSKLGEPSGRSSISGKGKERARERVSGASGLMECRDKVAYERIAQHRDAPRRPRPRPRRPRPSFPSTWLPILLLAVLALLSPARVRAAPPCLRFADYDSINALFTSGGPGTKVLLCPGKVYRLSSSIIFTAADQELATAGYPTDGSRAILRVQGHATTAVQGDCRRCKGVQIRNLIVDGNRQKLGRVRPEQDGPGLVVLGGNEGQVVRDCELRDPRGFTALHIREGDKLQCKGAMVFGNVIGPVGDEYIPAVDGDDPETSPLGRPLADGLTIACRDAVIRDNTFFDNTDAAIVLYCAPGTVVENNRISTKSLSAIAGMLMVDGSPFDGDYAGVKVRSNTLHAEGAPMRIGIGMGAAVLSDDTDTILRGAVVRDNTIKGEYLSYGIVAAGLADWTIEGNKFSGRYSGAPSARCFEDVEMPKPARMVVHRDSVKGSVQDGYANEAFQYNPLPSSNIKAEAVKPGAAQAKPNPNPVQAAPKPVDERGEQKPAAPPKPKVDTKPEAKKPPAAAPPAKNKDKDEAAKQRHDDHPHGRGHEHETDTADGLAPFFDTGSVMMDEILEHSLARVLEVVEALEVKVETKRRGGMPIKKGDGNGDRITDDIAGVTGRIVALEQSQKNVLGLASGLRSRLSRRPDELAKIESSRAEALNTVVSHVVHHYQLHPELEGGELLELPPGWPVRPIEIGATKAYQEAKKEAEKAERAALRAAGVDVDGWYGRWGWLLWLTGGAGVVWTAIRLLRSRRAGRTLTGGKSAKRDGVLNGYSPGSGDGGLSNGHGNAYAHGQGQGQGQGHSGGYAPNQTHAHARRRANSLEPAGGAGLGVGAVLGWRTWRWRVGEWWGGGGRAHRKII